MKERVTNMNFIKTKIFCSAKDNVKRMRRQVTVWQKIFVKDISDKELLTKMYTEFLKFNNKETNNMIKNWTKDLDTNQRR